MPRAASASDVIGAVERLAATHPDRTVWVGVDGFGGSGKTTLASRLSAAVDRVTVVHIDDFARPSVPEWEWDRFEGELAGPLRSGRTGRYQVWDWGADRGGEWLEVAPGRVLVVEGVSSTRREVRVSWDLTIWVTAPREVRLHRALERDGAEMLDTWLTRWIPPELAYAEREHPEQRVDLVVDGTADPSGGTAGPSDLGQSTT